MLRGCFCKTPSSTSNLTWLLILTGSDFCPAKTNDTAMTMFEAYACWKQKSSKLEIFHSTHCPKSEQNPQHTHPHPQPHDYPMLLQLWWQGSCVLGCCAWLRDSADSDRRSDCGRLMLTLVQNRRSRNVSLWFLFFFSCSNPGDSHWLQHVDSAASLPQFLLVPSL